MKINSLIKKLDAHAPLGSALSYDNVGLIIGDEGADIKKCGICLDVTASVINEASSRGINTIISHHPMIFRAVKKIIYGEVISDKIIGCIKNDINIIAMHTNLDLAKGGVNDLLAEKLRLQNISGYNKVSDESHSGENGSLYYALIGDNFEKNMPVYDYIDFIKKTLDIDAVQAVIKTDTVNKIGISCGAGMEYISGAYKIGVDTIITGDISHDEFIDASHYNMNIINAGHYHTEKHIVPALAKMISGFGIDAYELYADDAKIAMI